MKIAIVSLSYLPINNQSIGGIEVVVWNLAQALKKMGHEITLFGLSDSELGTKKVGIISSVDLREDGLAFDNKFFVRRYSVYQALALLEALKNSKEFDCIHVNLAEWQHGFLFASDENIVVTSHGNYMTPRLTKMIFEKNPKVKLACVSNFVKDKFFPDYENKYTVYNGINIDEYKPNFDGGDYLVWLGRITPIKDPKAAILVAKKLGLKLVIAGGIDYQDFFDRDVKPFLDENITYVGPVYGEVKNKLLAKAKALIFTPTSDEAFGLVAAEAQACGTPVVTLDKGALSEVVSDGQTGFVVKDLDEMAEKILEIDKISRQKCRQWAEDNFSSDKMAEGYVELYKKRANG